MQFRKLIFVLVITIIIVFGLLLGSSYAYYVSSDGLGINGRTGNFDAGVAVIFKQTEFVSTVTGIPISESDIEEKADKTVFTLTPNQEILDGYDVLITVSLMDITIDEKLRNEHFKYKLSCENNGTKKELKSGDGTDFNDDVTSLNIGTLSTDDTLDNSMTFSKESTTSCTLYIWLEESNEDQNELMNKGFSGVIKVNSVFKK